MTFTATTVPILGMYYENSSGTQQFPGAPSAWPAGATMNVANTYIAFDSSDLFNTYGTPFIQQCGENGLVPFVELEPWDYDQAAVLFSAITGGSWDTYFEQVGAAIAALGSPCMLTFAHEFNVNAGQYPWSWKDTGSGPGGGTLTAAEWIAGWQYAYTKVNESANGHALWMWAPGADTGGSSTTSPSPWWPGSGYVDMVGIDGYEALAGSPLTFNGVFASALTDIRDLGWTGDIYVSETNLALMVAGGGDSITTFVADMYANGMSGILEFEAAGMDVMTSEQWDEYNAAVTANYGGGGGGGGGGTPTYTYTQTLYDDFPGTSLNTSLWTEPVDSNGISVSGGSLKIEGLTNYEQVVLQTVFDRNLADGIFALQLSQSGTPVTGTMWFLGIADGPVSDGGNAYEFQTFPGGGSAGGAGSWYSWAFSGTDVSGDTGADDILALDVWANGDWLGIGNYNLNGTNDVHVYSSPDGATWTEIASWTVTGAIDEGAVGFYFGTNYDSGTAGTSTYVATVQNVSWFARGTSSGGGTSPSTGLVQETSGSTTGTSLTLTFPADCAAGTAVIVCAAGYYDGGLTGLTLGSTGDAFVHVAGSGGTGGANAGIWADQQCSGGTATVALTSNAAGIIAFAYNVAGMVQFDTAKGAVGTGTSWSSGATVETIPYPHFVVGAAVITANTGSITPGGSGWTNEASHTNIGGAGGHAIGAVSSYQQPTSSGTYTYSGTSSASSAWGSVTAAFLVVPVAGYSWGGILFNEHALVGYTGITCTFSIPESVPYVSPSDCSIWVGIGNVYQTGIYLSPDNTKTGNVGTSPWSWWFGGGGGAGELWDATAFPTGAGDSLTLELTLDGTYWYATITNHTRDWSYTEPKSVLGNNAGCWSYNAEGVPTYWGWIYPVGQAEIVIEQEGNSPNMLPDYGSIEFTSVTTTPAITQAPVPLFPVWATGDGFNEYPGPFDVEAGSFTMYWNKYD